jgi:hypothetical protein
MNESLDERPKPFLYVMVCAAGIAGDVGTLITMAQDRGWEVGVVATQGSDSLTARTLKCRRATRSGLRGDPPVTSGRFRLRTPSLSIAQPLQTCSPTG